MLFNIGDLVTRTSHNNDTIFKIIDINNNIAILKGVNIRLIADSDINDLNPVKKDEADITKDDRTLINNMEEFINLNRDEYFVHLFPRKRCVSKKMNSSSNVHIISSLRQRNFNLLLNYLILFFTFEIQIGYYCLHCVCPESNSHIQKTFNL